MKPVDRSELQYVKFPLGARALEAVRNGRAPVVVGVSHPAYTAEVELTRDTLESLSEDVT